MIKMVGGLWEWPQEDHGEVFPATLNHALTLYWAACHGMNVQDVYAAA